MKLRSEDLGRLIEVHRPMRGYSGWIAVLTPSIVLVLASFFTPDEVGFYLALGLAAGFILPMMYGTGEWFLLEHRFYENAIVFRSFVPGLKTYVVPWNTCDADSIDTIGRRVHDGTNIEEIVGRQFRQCPLTRTNIRMVGLDPSFAMAIGAGKESVIEKPWHEREGGFRSDKPRSVLAGNGRRRRQRWLFSSRTPDHHIALIKDLIANAKAASTS